MNPEPAPSESPAVRQPTSWERRSQLGLLEGLVQTWKLSVLKPGTFFPTLEPQGPLLDAVLYGWLLSGLGAVLQIPFTWLNFGQMHAQLAQLSTQLSSQQEFKEFFRVAGRLTESALPISLALAAATLVLYPLSLIITAGLVHLGALMFARAPNGYGATLRALAYAAGPAVLAWVPVVGGFAGLYLVVLQVWGLKEVQQTTVARAIASIIWLSVLVCCLGGAAAMVGAVMFAGKHH